MREIFSFAAPFAEAVEVHEAGTVRQARAFVEPVSLKAPDTESHPAVPGTVDGRRWLIIAEGEAFTFGREGAEIIHGGRHYVLLRSERFPDGHWEGILRLKGGCSHA